MKLKLIYIFLSFFIIIKLYSQENKTIDSLKNVLKKPLSEIEKISTLNELAWEVCINNPIDGIKYASDALQLSLKVKDVEGEATSYNRLGLSYELNGNTDSAIYYYNLSYQQRLVLSDVKGASNVLLNIGALYYIQGYYNLALKYYLDCAKLLETNNTNEYESTQSKVFNNIGLIHRTKKEYSEAIKWYFKSLNIKRKNKDETGKLNSFINLSMSYQNLKNYELADNYIDSALFIAKNNNLDNEYSGIFTNKASVQKDKSNHKQALKFILEAQKWLEKYPDKHIEIFTLLQLAEVQFENKEYNNSISTLNKIIELSESINRREILQRAYELIAICYEKNGDFKSAYQANKIHKAINDSIFNIDSKKSLDEQQTIFNVKENENKINKLNNENEKKELKLFQAEQKNFYTTILLIISISGLLILIYAWRQNRKNNLLLNQKNVLIANSLNEKELLLKEIHHRVKNNLQIITGLLELQESLHQNKEIGNLVSEAQGRIKTMAIIHEMLYQTDDISKINLGDYIEKLINSIELGYSSHNPKLLKNISIQKVFFNIDTIIPLGLILNELISNAFKYVYSVSKGNELSISIEQLSELEWRLIIKDDGPGIPNNGLGEREGSFGLKLVKMLSRQLKGKVDYNHNNGSVFSIIFKEQKIN